VDVLDQLATLDQRHAEAVAARREIEAAERLAYEAVREAEATLEELIRQRMSGDEPPAKLITDTQKRLDRARAQVQREWAVERRAGDRVVLDAARARQGFVVDQFDDLLAEAHERADQVAQGDRRRRPGTA
jgi:23S rRNA G2069 N7-methylase RlmK/C1962 C5-methylase RlmI